MSTKIKTPDGWKDVAGNTISAEYIRNQNILSDYEDITLPFTAQYDGELVITPSIDPGTGNRLNCDVSINNSLLTRAVGQVEGSGNAGLIPISCTVKKGDTVSVTLRNGTVIAYKKARFYKLRDYTGR